MSKTIVYALVVASLAHDGYRRAGLAFKKGDNTFDGVALSDAQLAALKADTRLAVKKAEPLREADQKGRTLEPQLVGSLNGTVGGVVTLDGEHKTLAELTLAELRPLAESLDIEGAKTLKKDELVAAIEATQVEVHDEGQDA
ncbi:HI1506-related protein [Gallaecimonas kandeliae]|uniref:HI1506-related protein n=1 Tax=Gallaecimonas kandeliae TaxID=3029055 RepID=UPI002649246F|nr:HI1506-related protein [Gallaecimonas kandeliae]WKE64338.1 HI1506-related protein [Gallaecimonas kandeliae]